MKVRVDFAPMEFDIPEPDDDDEGDRYSYIEEFVLDKLFMTDPDIISITEI